MTVYKAADMAKWTAKAKRNVRLVILQSVQDVTTVANTIDDKGGKLPFEFGDLRDSFVMGFNGSTSLTGPAQYTATLAGFEVGDTINAGWTVEYALRQEKGFVGTDEAGRTYNQSGAFFMESALMDWQGANDRNAARIAGD